MRRTLTEVELNEIARMRAWVVDFMKKHKPLLIEIRKDSKPVNDQLAKDHPQLHFFLWSPEEFIRVSIAKADSGSVTELDAADSLCDQVGEALNDFFINSEIPAKDLVFIKGAELKSIFK